MSGNDFLPLKGNYRDLMAFQKAEAIYDITFLFTGKFLSKGDRTVDQMIQAARSGKQNIAEGSAAATTSKEMEIKLINVAKASLQELLLDYEDYLRVKNLETWRIGNPRLEKLREICIRNNDSEFFRNLFEKCTDEMAANLAITLIHQADMLLRKLIERLKEDFRKGGGIREEMSRARREYRQNRR